MYIKIVIVFIYSYLGLFFKIWFALCFILLFASSAWLDGPIDKYVFLFMFVSLNGYCYKYFNRFYYTG